MVDAAPITLKLDDYLKDMIQAVYGACNVAASHMKDADPKIVDEALENCQEVLDTVMEGHVDEWVS